MEAAGERNDRKQDEETRGNRHCCGTRRRRWLVVGECKAIGSGWASQGRIATLSKEQLQFGEESGPSHNLCGKPMIGSGDPCSLHSAHSLQSIMDCINQQAHISFVARFLISDPRDRLFCRNFLLTSGVHLGPSHGKEETTTPIQHILSGLLLPGRGPAARTA